MIHFNSISKQFGPKVLFENVNAHIGYRSRIALIGANGSGKSTLIRMILGLEHEDQGTLSKVSHLSIGHLAQEVPKFENRSVFQEVIRLDGRRDALHLVKKELEGTLEKDPEDESALEHYGRVLEELELMDEYRIEPRAKEILQGIGFQPKDFDRNLSEFSGGWLMRVALARILLQEPDLLLLDEPTNHLDLESLLWLEEFLLSFRGALLLVSHDTAFLNRMVNEVFEIDQQKIWTYRGNLDAFAEQKTLRLENLKARYEAQQEEIARMQSFIDRFRAKATKARQAQSRIKRLEKMERIELQENRSTVRFRFPPASHSGREVVRLENADFSYPHCSPLFSHLQWTLQRGSRVAIVGMNGAGKTTLLKLLSGKLKPTSGSIRLGHQVIPGYYAQLQTETLCPQKTVLEELELTAPQMPLSQVRSIAGAFLFTGDSVNQYCAVLSGGEKARVALAKLLLAPSNFLCLDEPTNHLDVDSRAILQEALQDYEGTLCLISHDRDFISPLVDTVLEIVPSHPQSHTSQLIPWIGSYEDYLEKLQNRIRNESDQRKEIASFKHSSPTELSDSPKKPSNNQKNAWLKEQYNLEKEIESLENRLKEIDCLLGDLATYKDPHRPQTLSEERRTLDQRLGIKLNRWEEISVLLSCE